MISVEINTALKAHFNTFSGNVYKNIKIFPLSAYDETDAPFIVYYEYAGTQSEEQWFLKISNVMYYVYDNDISRMKDISHEIDKFLNVGDNVSGIRGKITVPSSTYGSLRYNLKTSRKVAGSVLAPMEREGFASQMLNFRMVYVDA
jgi:hypothetical protein